MDQYTMTAIIKEQTDRALWEVKNVIDCVPDDLWNKNYCDMPCWKHIYHMLHSLDFWYINSRDREFTEPPFHEKDLMEYPPDCEYCRFTLILAQFRHLHSHMGMIMGFIIDDKGLWPRVLGLEMPFPGEVYDKYL